MDEERKEDKKLSTEKGDTFVSLGADPSEMDALRNSVAYYSGYKRGVWDVLYAALTFFIMLSLFRLLMGQFKD